MKFIVFALALFVTNARAENWEHLKSTWGGLVNAYLYMDRDSISRSGLSITLKPSKAKVTIRDDYFKEDYGMRDYYARQGTPQLAATRLYVFEANCQSKEYSSNGKTSIYKGPQWNGVEDYVFEQICQPIYK